MRIKESLSLNNCRITSLINYVPSGLELKVRDGVWKAWVFGKTLQQWKTPNKETSLHSLHHSTPLYTLIPPNLEEDQKVWLRDYDIVLVICSLSLRLIMKILWVVGWKWFWRKCFQALQMLNILRTTYHTELKIHSNGIFFLLQLYNEFWCILETLLGLVLCWGTCRPLQSHHCDGKKSKLLKACSVQWTVTFIGIGVGGSESRQLFSG